MATGNTRPSVPSASHPVSDQPALEDIRSYKKWTRVNAMALPLNPLNAGLCRMPDTRDRIESQENPHRGKFFAVYVNEIGRQALMLQLKPSFPQNSIIIKEKLPAQSSSAPELLTVMIKRDKGFNPVLGDWEFMVVDGMATQIQGRGKLAHCQTCHLLTVKTDYVFRTYLPDDVRSKLQ